MTCITVNHKMAIIRNAVKETIVHALDEETREPNAALYDDVRVTAWLSIFGQEYVKAQCAGGGL